MSRWRIRKDQEFRAVQKAYGNNGTALEELNVSYWAVKKCDLTLPKE